MKEFLRPYDHRVYSYKEENILSYATDVRTNNHKVRSEMKNYENVKLKNNKFYSIGRSSSYIYQLFIILVLIETNKCQTIENFYKDLKADIGNLAAKIRIKFQNRCQNFQYNSCNKIYSSCSLSIPGEKCLKKTFISDCEDNQIKASTDITTLRLQNKYDDLINLKNYNSDVNNNYKYLKELSCPLENNEIYSDLKTLNDKFTFVDQFYIASYKGTFHVSPGYQFCTKLKEFYPPERPWFCYGATGFRNIIILLDASEIYDENIGKIFIYINSAIDLIITSLSSQDYISILLFNDDIITDEDYRNQNKNTFTINNFTQPDKYYKSNVKKYLEWKFSQKLKSSTNSVKSLKKAISYSFDLLYSHLKATNQKGKNAIFLLSNGINNDNEENVRLINYINNEFNINPTYMNKVNFKPIFFIYTLGNRARTENINILNSVVCKLNGIHFYGINDLQTLLQKLAQYCLIIAEKISSFAIKSDSERFYLIGPYDSLQQGKYSYSFSMPVFVKLDDNRDYLIYSIGLDIQQDELYKIYAKDSVDNFFKNNIDRSQEGTENFEISFCKMENFRKKLANNFSCFNIDFDRKTIFNQIVPQICQDQDFTFDHKLCENEFKITNGSDIFYDKVEEISLSERCCNKDYITVIIVVIGFVVLVTLICLIIKFRRNRKFQSNIFNLLQMKISVDRLKLDENFPNVKSITFENNDYEDNLRIFNDELQKLKKENSNIFLILDKCEIFHGFLNKFYKEKIDTGNYVLKGENFDIIPLLDDIVTTFESCALIFFNVLNVYVVLNTIDTLFSNKNFKLKLQILFYFDDGIQNINKKIKEDQTLTINLHELLRSVNPYNKFLGLKDNLQRAYHQISKIDKSIGGLLFVILYSQERKKFGIGIELIIYFKFLSNSF